VGASLRSGSHAGLEDGSAYLSLELKEWSASRVREALRSAPREPSSPRGRLAAGLSVAARPLAAVLSRRMGSTALVSSLGRVAAPSEVHQLAFFPVAHGRSGVALGMATVQDVTVITWRCRRRSFSAQAAEDLADVVLGELDGGLGGLKQRGKAERSPPDGGLGGRKQRGKAERSPPGYGA